MHGTHDDCIKAIVALDKLPNFGTIPFALAENIDNLDSVIGVVRLDKVVFLKNDSDFLLLYYVWIDIEFLWYSSQFGRVW